MDEESCWDLCPVELLMMIFNFLDLKSLGTCLMVNRRWYDIVDDIIWSKKGWQDLVVKCMANGGKSYRRKSVLSWRQMYLNSLEWYDVKKAELNHVRTIDTVVSSFSIYRDNLILVTQCIVKYINIENFKCLREFSCLCTQFEESDELVTVLWDNCLKMYGKLNKDDQSLLSGNIYNNVLLYRLEDNKVYIIGINNKILSVYTWNEYQWTINTIRFYGPAQILHGLVHNDQMYILTEGARAFRSTQGLVSFEYFKMSRFLMPPSIIIKGFGVFEDDALVVFGDSKRKGVHYTFDVTTRVIFIESPGLTTATQHGDLALLGFNNGTVQILRPVNILKGEEKPERTFNVGRNSPVIGIDVYESIDSHHIFVHTSLPSCIHHIQIQCYDYLKLKECLDDDIIYL